MKYSNRGFKAVDSVHSLDLHMLQLFHGAFATGVTCQEKMFTLPVIRFCLFLRLAYALIVETTFLKPSVLFQTFRLGTNVNLYQTKQTYRGMFEIQKSGKKTSSGEIGLDIRTHASPKVGQEQVSGGVSVLCWHASPVANVLWKPHQITSG